MTWAALTVAQIAERIDGANRRTGGPNQSTRTNVDVKTLKSILRTMRDQGCLKLEMPELKVELVPEALLPQARNESAPAETEERAIPSEAEIDKLVFWSAPQLDDTQK